MLKFHEIITLLNDFCPLEKAEIDDVVGKQVSLPKNKKIKKVLITLDCNYLAIEKAIKNQIDLIITHHPLLWPTRRIALKSLDIKSKVEKLRKAKIAVYTMHTNYDEMYLKTDLIRLILPDGKIDKSQALITIGKVTENWTMADLLKKLKNIFGITKCSYYGKLNQKIHKISLTPGAGGFALNTINEQKIDVLITGEIKWNHWIKAQELKQSVIVLGHQMEEVFTQKMPFYLKEVLKKENKTLDIETMFHNSIQKYH